MFCNQFYLKKRKFQKKKMSDLKEYLEKSAILHFLLLEVYDKTKWLYENDFEMSQKIKGVTTKKLQQHHDLINEMGALLKEHIELHENEFAKLKLVWDRQYPYATELFKLELLAEHKSTAWSDKISKEDVLMSDTQKYLVYTEKLNLYLQEIHKLCQILWTDELELPKGPRFNIPFKTMAEHKIHIHAIGQALERHIELHNSEFAALQSAGEKALSKVSIHLPPQEVKIEQNIQLLSLQQLLTTHEFTVVPRSSQSDSVILKAIFNNKKYVLKLTTDSPENDNSLEVERLIYNLVSSLLANSPHFLVPVTIGMTKDKFILDMRSEYADSAPRQLFEKWVESRLNVIEKSATDNEIADLKKFNRNNGLKTRLEIGERLLVQNEVWKTRFRNVHYVITPEMKGITLKAFLAQKKLPNNILPIILIQLAQSLSAADDAHMMHNDLHAENVYIETLTTPKIISYIYPMHVNITVSYEVTIFDFDRSSTPSIENTGLSAYCVPFGQCTTFQAKFDWFTILSHIMFHASDNYVPQVEIVSNLLKKLYQAPSNHGIEGKNSFFGLPCKCERVEQGVCVSCKRWEDDDFQSLISPREYFVRFFAGNGQAELK